MALHPAKLHYYYSWSTRLSRTRRSQHREHCERASWTDPLEGEALSLECRSSVVDPRFRPLAAWPAPASAGFLACSSCAICDGERRDREKGNRLVRSTGKQKVVKGWSKYALFNGQIISFPSSPVFVTVLIQHHPVHLCVLFAHRVQAVTARYRIGAVVWWRWCVRRRAEA